ncbi:MAG: T9SS type A sorting domain-containing protein [Candidatus Marinimicrobia bacterium]|nr:T9SS type A sorting domain-containing protein [Candidatus Neomarinimicrobiota bacterium]
MKGKKHFFLIILLLITTGLFADDYYYVDPSGTDDGAHGAGPGTDAWQTIQYAVDNVTDPDDNDIVIYISAGTFNLWDGSTTQTIIVNRPFQDLTLQGAGAENTIIQGHSVQGSADGRVFSISDTWGDIRIHDLTIRYGNTSGEGGGIYNREAYLVLENCNIAYNHADDRGGGILNGYRGVLALYYCTVHHNTTDGDGGGISNYESVHVTFRPILDIRNSTISHNTAANRGGGISARSIAYTNPGSRVDICNATISQNNSGGQGGGIYYGPNSSAQLKNTILGNNDSASDEGEDVYFYPPDEDMDDYGYNIIEDYDGYDFSAEASNHTGPQPFLNLSSILESNFTMEGTYTLKTSSGSIAIDNGDDTPIPAWGVGYTRDQRNAPINEEIDIGAYEWWADSGNFPAEPAEHVSGFSATPFDDVQIDLAWTENDGDNAADGYLIKASTGGIIPPDDNTDPADDTDLTDGSGNVKVAHGTTSYSFDNCSSSTTYIFRIYPYTNDYGYMNYKKDGLVPNDDATTYKSEPSNHVADFVAERGGTGLDQVNCSWTDSEGGQLPDAYLIKASNTGFGAIVAPVDGTEEVDDTDLSDGAGVVNIAHGGKGSYNWTALSEGTIYYFMIYPYTNSGTAINYKTDGDVPSASKITLTTAVAGDLIITEIVGDAVHPMMPNDGYIEFLNISGSLLNLADVQVRYYDNGSPVPTSTMDLTGYVDVGEYKVICQEHSFFLMAYGVDADFQAPYNWGTMTSEFPLDGGEDVIEMIIPDKKVIIDQFNDPADPWSWDAGIVLERTSLNPGTNQGSWTENPTGTGTPGGENLNTLPVELQYFSAVYNTEGTIEFVALSWATASEADVLGFNVYRSERDDVSVAGNRINQSLISAAGTSTQTNEYYFDDLDASILVPHYYWLEVVNLNGNSEFYGSIKYTPGDSNGDNCQDFYLETILGNSYPNPVRNSTEVSYKIRGSISDQNTVINIYNILGELVKTVQATEGRAIINVTDLSNGIYFYVLRSSTSYDVKRFVVFK